MFIVKPEQATLGGGHCIICQQGFDRFTQSFCVDTNYDAEIPGHVLDGRKYVCQGCISDITSACGFLSAGDVRKIKEEFDAFKRLYMETQLQVRINVAELSDKLITLPELPNLDFIAPSNEVADAEAIEAAKPKRGRPKAESTF